VLLRPWLFNNSKSNQNRKSEFVSVEGGTTLNHVLCAKSKGDRMMRNTLRKIIRGEAKCKYGHVGIYKLHFALPPFVRVFQLFRVRPVSAYENPEKNIRARHSAKKAQLSQQALPISSVALHRGPSCSLFIHLKARIRLKTATRPSGLQYASFCQILQLH